MIETEGEMKARVKKNVEDVIGKELKKAREKHPCFSVYDAVSIIAEELGELAEVFNDQVNEKPEEFYRRSIEEASHVAVTATRTLEELFAGMLCRNLDAEEILHPKKTIELSCISCPMWDREHPTQPGKFWCRIQKGEVVGQSCKMVTRDGY